MLCLIPSPVNIQIGMTVRTTALSLVPAVSLLRKTIEAISIRDSADQLSKEFPSFHSASVQPKRFNVSNEH